MEWGLKVCLIFIIAYLDEFKPSFSGGGGGGGDIWKSSLFMYGIIIRKCNRSFSRAEISAFFPEMFFQISVVILNSTLHYQIFKFDIDIQILVWIFGSTYRKGEILKQKAKSDMSTVNCFTVK